VRSFGQVGILHYNCLADSNVEEIIMRKIAVMAASSTGALFAVALAVPNQAEAITLARPAVAAATFDGVAKPEQVRRCRTRGCWGRYYEPPRYYYSWGWYNPWPYYPYYNFGTGQSNFGFAH
jgi:hypothetical protein